MGSKLADDLSAAATLWHYTSFPGLIGILESRNLRLSSIGFLNDGLEFDFGYQKVRDAITEVFQGKPENAKSQAHWIITKFNGYIRKRAVYAASFSVDGDSLSMWRAYGGSGPSYAIGFNRERLLAVASLNKVQAKRILYEPHEIKQDVEARVSEHFEGYENSEEADPTRHRSHHAVGDSGRRLAHDHLEWCALYKHKSFDVEKEYRLIKLYWSFEEIKSFRQSGSLIVPYIELALPLESPENPICHFRVGPSAHMRECMEALDIMAKRFCPGRSIEISKSESPYRNW